MMCAAPGLSKGVPIEARHLAHPYAKTVDTIVSVRRELAHGGSSFGSRSFGFVPDKGSKLVVFDTSYFGRPDRILATNSLGLGLLV
jgi:hypothetical protein